MSDATFLLKSPNAKVRLDICLQDKMDVTHLTARSGLLVGDSTQPLANELVDMLVQVNRRLATSGG